LVDLQAEFNELKISSAKNSGDQDVEMEEGVGVSDEWRLDQYYN
jgi:hypothetical protein